MKNTVVLLWAAGILWGCQGAGSPSTDRVPVQTLTPVLSPSPSPGPVVSPPPAPGLVLTLGEYNTEGFNLGGSAPPTGTYDRVAQVECSLGTDILAVEEIQTNDQDAAHLQAAFTAQGRPMPYCAVTKMYNGLAEALFSRYPITASSDVLVPAGAWPRSVLKAQVAVGSSSFTFFVCHLKSGTDLKSLGERQAQAAALEAYLKTTYGPALGSENIVVTGDMNTMNDGDRTGSGATLTSLQLLDDQDGGNDFWSANEALLPGVNTIQGYPSVLDHIILSPHLKPWYEAGSVRVLQAGAPVDLTKVTDHYPVVLKLDLPS